VSGVLGCFYGIDIAALQLEARQKCEDATRPKSFFSVHNSRYVLHRLLKNTNHPFRQSYTTGIAGLTFGTLHNAPYSLDGTTASLNLEILLVVDFHHNIIFRPELVKTSLQTCLLETCLLEKKHPLQSPAFF
jgi:hypothetical protein